MNFYLNSNNLDNIFHKTNISQLCHIVFKPEISSVNIKKSLRLLIYHQYILLIPVRKKNSRILMYYFRSIDCSC